MFNGILTQYVVTNDCSNVEGAKNALVEDAEEEVWKVAQMNRGRNRGSQNSHSPYFDLLFAGQ